MNTNGTITHLQICTQHRAPMRIAQSANAIGGLGLEDDVHARKDSSRQVLLIDEETLSAFGLTAGRVRENITTRGIELKTLAEGAHVRVGDAVLEITKPCAPCDFIEAIRPGLRAEMEGQRGMLARVIKGGEIRVGDVVQIVTEQALDSATYTRIGAR